jgi:transposase-like protein
MHFYRKRVSKEQKFNILSEHFNKGTPISELARVNNIYLVTLYHWKKFMNKKPDENFDLEELIRENQKLKKDNELLTKALGKAHVSLECGKEIIEILKKKSLEHQLKKQEKSSKK